MLLPKIRKAVMVAPVFCVGVMLTSQAISQKPPVVPPHPTKLVKPDCSVGKDCHGIHGVVIVTVDVLTDGTVGEANIKNGDSRLAGDALKSAKQCRFQPGTFNGKPTSMDFDVKYEF
jgi:TonB family protein